MQETYNKVRDHLLAQGKRSMLKSCHTCAYRGQGGTKCAVGVLIPDECYREEMEGKTVDRLITLWMLTREEIFGRPVSDEEMRLIQDLQGVHDTFAYEPAKDWPEALAKVALKHGLQP